MKKYIFIYFLVTFAKVSVGQTIFTGTEKFENSVRFGLYICLQSDKKFIDEEWKTYISKFGSVKQDEDNFIIKNALFEQILTKSTAFYSKIIIKHKYQSKLFVSIDSLNTSEKNRIFIEKILKDYYQYSLKNEEQRFIENELIEAKNSLEELEKKLLKNQKKFKRTLKNDEKLNKNIDQAQVKIQTLEEKNTAKDAESQYSFQEKKKEILPENESEIEKNKKKLDKSIDKKIDNANKRQQLLESEATLQQMIQEAERKVAEIQKNVSLFKAKQI